MPYRINRVGDSFIRLIYFYLCIAAYFISYRSLIKNLKVIDYWIYGALIATIYGWYLFIFSHFHIPYFKLPGMDENPQMLNGFIRCGTFKEGNYFGLFLLLSSSISFYRKKFNYGVFFLISIIMTMSTMSIVSGLIFILFYFRRKIFNKTAMIKTIPFIILFFIFFVRTEYFKKFVYSKIFEKTNELKFNNYSKIERSSTALTGYYMGLNNPFFGVGPANYSPNFDKYNSYKKIIKRRYKSLDIVFSRHYERVIPNNVYIEIWCEYGVLGFLLFIIFLLYILYKSFKMGEDAITGGLISLILSINAFPSFIMFFLWVYLSIPIALQWFKNQNKNNNE